MERNTFSLILYKRDTNADNDVISKLNATVPALEWTSDRWYDVCKQLVDGVSQVDNSDWACVMDDNRGCCSGLGFQFYSRKSFIRTAITRRYWDPERLSGGGDSRQFILFKQ